MRTVQALLALLSLVFTLAEVRYGDGLPGEDCVMGGGVIGYCEETWACLEDGGVVKRMGVVQLCRSHDQKVFLCCRKPHLVARELCDAWSYYWRGSEGQCAVEKPLIVGGEDARLGEFPHTAIIGSRELDGPIDYFCGGTLISPYHILTAAHCLFGYKKGITYWAKLGEHDRLYNSSELIEIITGPIPSSLYQAAELQDEMAATTTTTTTDGDDDADANYPHMAPVKQEIQLVGMEIYPHYPRWYHYHDIAVVRLKTPVKLTKRVLPACLPLDPYDDHQGKHLTVVGWGHTTGVQEMSRILQKVKVPVVDRLTCDHLVNNPFSVPMGITSDMLCAGAMNRDSCQGDSGGPLTEQVPRKGSTCEHTVLGVVSFGTGSTHSRCGSVGVYVRVTSYLDWITGFVAPNSTGQGVYYSTTSTPSATNTTTPYTTSTTTTTTASQKKKVQWNSDDDDTPFLGREADMILPDPNSVNDVFEDFMDIFFPDKK